MPGIRTAGRGGSAEFVISFDSFTSTGHNYYLYRDPRDPRFAILNWDWNLSFGTFQTWFAQPRRPVADLFS